MKYQYSEEKKRKAIKKQRMIMTISYLFGALLFSYRLYRDWSIEALEIKVILIISITVLFPLTWIFFDRKFSVKMSCIYELTDKNLLITEKGILKHKIPLQSIRKLKKLPTGHEIQSNSGTAYILNGIENKDELIKKLYATIG